MNTAFFMNIHPRVKVFLLLLIFSPPLFIKEDKFFVAVADNKLVQALCHNSETPETCLKCVNSSKNAVEADSSVGIAMAIVNCIKDKANNLSLNLAKLASTSHGKLKSISRKCASDYHHHIAKKEFGSTKHALRNHQYDNAETFVARALSIHLCCRKNLTSDYNGKVPSDVFNDMVIFEELSEAASRVIEKL